MNCYGRWYGHLDECAKCPHRKYCREAADPPLLPREQSVRAETVDDLPDQTPLPSEAAKTAKEALAKENTVYSRQDLLEVIVFMARLDTATLELLDEKLQHPEFGFADMARKRNISRQAVHKFIRKRCQKIPELQAVLQKPVSGKNSSTTFWEEVCKIRQKQRAMPSRKPKADLNCLRRLTCSIRNLDLSGTSMFSGGSILKNA